MYGTMTSHIQPDSPLADERSEIRLILVGGQGSGKSATGNTILGRQVFEDHAGAYSKESGCRYGKTVKDGYSILVVDTPGLIEQNAKDTCQREVGKCLLLSSPGPHAVILVINAGRQYKDLKHAPQVLEEIFGVGVKKRYLIVVLTGGDQLRHNKMSKEDFIKSAPKYMRGIFTKYPVVVFNNWEDDVEVNRQQVDRFIEEVMSRNDRHWSNDLYKQIEELLLKAEGIPNE